MDSGKYVDMAVQNPHGVEMIRLIFLPRNFKIFLGEIERFMPLAKSKGLVPSERCEDYALNAVLY